MMQNSPDPEEEEEEVLEEDDGGEISSQADSVLLQEMQALTQTFNNNWSYEGEGPWAGFTKDQTSPQCPVLIVCFLEGSHFDALTGLELSIQTRLVLIPQSSAIVLKDYATVP